MRLHTLLLVARASVYITSLHYFESRILLLVTNCPRYTTAMSTAAAAGTSICTAPMSEEDEKLPTMPTRSRSDKIRLNVGGKHFVTTVGTLCKEESMLSAMIEGKSDTQPDADGEVRCTLFIVIVAGATLQN